MKEIISRGPVVGDLEVPLSFSYYKEGIFSEEHSAVLKSRQSPTTTQPLSDENISYHTLSDYHIEW